MHALFSFSCSIPSHAVINWIQIWRIQRPQLRWSFGVSFFMMHLSFTRKCRDIKKKRLHDFVAIIFGKLHTKFHQSRPSFEEDITNYKRWQLRTHCNLKAARRCANRSGLFAQFCTAHAHKLLFLGFRIKILTSPFDSATQITKFD